MNPELYYYLVLFFFIAIGAVIIAAPHFPGSEVSKEKNNDAFIAMTVVGTIIILPFLYWMIMIFIKTTWSDFQAKKGFRRIRSTGSLRIKNRWWPW
jgi:hypothetical protein